MREMASRKTKPIDLAIGRRIRFHRMKAKLSYRELADRVGVSFQQLQKYENGLNRIAAARLMEIATALGVPISAFFEGMTATLQKSQKTEIAADLLTMPRTIKLVAEFYGIPDRTIQDAISRMVKAIRSSRPRQKT